MAYHDPIYETYTLAAASTVTAATLLSIVGPAGKEGIVVSLNGVMTAAADAAQVVNVGDSGDADEYGILNIATTDAAGDAVVGTINTSDAVEIPADSVVLIAAGGGGTTGAADLKLTVAWF